MPIQVARDVSSIVWIGVLALLFLAIAVHEGWFGGSSNPIVTSASSGNVGAGSSSPLPNGTGAVDATGAPDWLSGLMDSPWTGLIF
jgi:hypothetical protein